MSPTEQALLYERVLGKRAPEGGGDAFPESWREADARSSGVPGGRRDGWRRGTGAAAPAAHAGSASRRPRLHSPAGLAPWSGLASALSPDSPAAMSPSPPRPKDTPQRKPEGEAVGRAAKGLARRILFQEEAEGDSGRERGPDADAGTLAATEGAAKGTSYLRALSSDARRWAAQAEQRFEAAQVSGHGDRACPLGAVLVRVSQSKTQTLANRCRLLRGGGLINPILPGGRGTRGEADAGAPRRRRPGEGGGGQDASGGAGGGALSRLFF
jgi:hypothetical protein